MYLKLFSKYVITKPTATPIRTEIKQSLTKFPKIIPISLAPKVLSSPVT